mgnify:CR=1 FL=1
MFVAYSFRSGVRAASGGLREATSGLERDGCLSCCGLLSGSRVVAIWNFFSAYSNIGVGSSGQVVDTASQRVCSPKRF